LNTAADGPAVNDLVADDLLVRLVDLGVLAPVVLAPPVLDLRQPLEALHRRRRQLLERIRSHQVPEDVRDDLRLPPAHLARLADVVGDVRRDTDLERNAL